MTLWVKYRFLRFKAFPQAKVVKHNRIEERLDMVSEGTMSRMHSDAQFAGSSSVPAHVEMMGFLGIGNNPMVGCTVTCAVDVATALNK